MAGDDELLDLDTGMLTAATKQFSTGLNAFKSHLTNAGTVWNGQASELLNLPLSPTIVEALTVEQIEGWGAKGNVRMLIGVLNTAMPETIPPSDASARLKGHRDTALRVILGRGAKSLDALVVSLELNRSQRIILQLDDMVQTEGEVTARGGALAALRILADPGSAFGRTLVPMLADKRLHATPGFAAVDAAARERGAAAAVIRVEALLATHEKERAELRTNCQMLVGLADTVIQGPDGPAVRIRHLPTLSAGFEDLRRTYSARLSQATDGANLAADLWRMQRVAAIGDSPELREAMDRLEDLWLNVLQERCAFIDTEAAVAVALADRANFRGLPVYVAATERIAMLAQAGMELTDMNQSLHQEIDAIDRALNGLPDESPLRQRKRNNRTAIVTFKENLQGAADNLVQAIENLEAGVRTDEAMFRKRVVEIEGFTRGVTGAVDSLLDIMGNPGWPNPERSPSLQASLNAGHAELVTAIRSFAMLGGPFSKLGGLRLLAAVIEGIAVLVEGVDFSRPGQRSEPRAAVDAALVRAQNSGLVRQPEVDAAMLLLVAVDRLDNP